MMDFIDIKQGEEPDNPINTYNPPQHNNIWDHQEQLEVIQHYTSEENIPKSIKKKNWAIFSKTASLTFLEEKDLPIVEMETQIARLSEMISTPPYDLTFSKIQELQQMSIHSRNTARRAVGMKRDRINERTAQITQVSQQISMGGGHGGHGNHGRKKFFGLI